MTMISIRCKECNREIVGHPSKTVTCGCPNMATIRVDKISARDLSKIVMLNNISQKKPNNVLKNEDLMWQEERKKRKIRKLNFEIR